MYKSYTINKRLKSLKTIYWHKRPFMLVHRITVRCNCRCKACNFWQIDEYKDRREMDVDELAGVFREASSLGMTDYHIYGGEPLLREDLPQVLAAARSAGMHTSFPTNGLLLEQRAEEVAAGLDNIIVSIDAIGEDHDRLRGVPGTFDKAIRGIQALKSTGKPILIRFWTQINRENLSALPEVARLARDLDVEVEFVPTVVMQGHNEHLILDPGERKEMIEALKELKKKGYPIINLFSSLDLLESGEPFICNIPRLSVTFDWDGTVIPCVRKFDDPIEWFPPFTESNITDLLGHPERRAMVERLKHCNDCQLACTMATKNNLMYQKLIHIMEVAYIRWVSRRYRESATH